MKLALLSGLVALGFGFNNPQQCFPPSCRIDANCVDSIHGLGVSQGSAKCCGGVCLLVSSLPTDRLIGEPCMSLSGTLNNYESCGGRCGPGLYCSDVDRKCHALHGAGCNCTVNSDCLENSCKLPNVTGATQNLCRARNSVPTGGPCDAGDQCQSTLCDGTKCINLNPGDVCPFGNTKACAAPATCKYNSSAGNYLCFAPCGLNVTGCCSTSSDCLGYPSSGVSCDFGTRACLPPPPPADLDQSCVSSNCKNTTTMVCASPCNSTISSNPCNSYPPTCQLQHQIALGNPCSDSRQCPLNSSCISNGTITVCQAMGTVALGQPCSSSSNYFLCAAPGNICSSNGTTYVCKANGTVSAGSYCSLASNNYLGLEECVSGTQCAYNGSSYSCLPQLGVGALCTTYGVPACVGGNQNCAPNKAGGSTSCSSTFYQCGCVTPKVVADGGACNATIQCKGADSACASNGTCVPIIGQDCATVSDCGEGYPRYDCSCNRKCYLLNAPTPAPAPYPPSPPTPGRCDKQRDAWRAKQPVGFVWPYYNIEGYVEYNSFQCPTCGTGGSFVDIAVALSTADQATLIDYVCCYSCPSNLRFTSNQFQGYQVDCAAKTLTKMPDTCNDLRSTLAFLNCWTNPVSSAMTASLGFGALLFAAMMY